MHFWKLLNERVSFGAPSVCRGTILWTSGRGLGEDVSWSREITYKKRCIICQFAMWLPGRESGRTAAELPCQSCWTAAKLPLLELPDCHQSSPTRAAGLPLEQSGSSAPGVWWGSFGGTPATPAGELRRKSGSSAPGVQSLSPPCLGSIRTSGVKAKVPFPQFFLSTTRDSPLRVFTCCGSTVRRILYDS